MTDPRLETLARRYKASVAGRYRAIRPSDLQVIPHAPCFVSRKLDGELWLAELHKGKARMLGEPAKITVTYQQLINASDAEWDEAFTDPIATPDARTSLAPLPTTPKTGYNAEA